MVAVQQTLDHQPTKTFTVLNDSKQQKQQQQKQEQEQQDKPLDNVLAIIGYVAALVLPHQLFAARFWEWISQYTDFQVFIYGSAAIILTVVSLHMGLMTLIDLGYFPKSLDRYRIQPNKRSVAAWYYKTLPMAATNLLIISPIALWVSYNIVTYGQQHPFGVLGCATALEITYYYGHRAAHHPRVYKYVHKVHHDFTAPIPIAAFHMHPLDFIATNAIPVLIGPVLLQLHLMTVWLWVSIILVIHVHLHCGLELPFLPTPMDHDYHHQVFNSNFGVFGFLDVIHNTRGKYSLYRANWQPKNPIESTSSSAKSNVDKSS
ncbi:hypothetical protein BDF19DRAFT_435340 [Syncephalis fuscata]|nr:hypothetical protein BDF19DRAFT_435340 [Syncephalis fuscata]